MNNKTSEIDFVIPWVNGNDPQWLDEFNKYKPDNLGMNKKSNFRDWDNLQYIFRAFEYFTPWVNKIYFITCGHLPKWLNVNHDKLIIIRHGDYMDKENLPIFNSHVIEINLHKIKGLSEKFVYFNDDFFILEPIKAEIFFKNNLPVDIAIANIMHEGEIAHVIVNNIDIINKNFNRHIDKKLTKRNIISKNFIKWFYPGYGLHSINTLLLMYWKVFTGFIDYHHPQPYLKNTFREIWNKEPEFMKQVSTSRFRDSKDVNQYLFRYWQLVKGNFYPGTYKKTYTQRKYINMRSKNDAIIAANDIKSGKYQMYCPNDTMSKGRYTEEDVSDSDFDFSKNIINNALKTILPKKSSFEI